MTHVKINHAQGYPQNLWETKLMLSLSRKPLNFCHQPFWVQTS